MSGAPTAQRIGTAEWLPSLVAAGNGVLIGSAMVATRYAVGEATPASLAFWRYAIGFCCLLPFVLLGARVRLARADLLPLALLGIGQFGILIVLLNYALQYITSARSALIFATMPLLTMLLAAALRMERLTWPKAAGVTLTILGVGLALGEKALAGGGGETAWQGELAVLGSAFVGATCSVLYRPYLRKYPTLPVSAFAMLAAVLFLAVLAAGEGYFAQPPSFSPGAWGAVAFIGVNSGLGYYLWLWALGHGSPTKVTAFLALSPVTALALGAFLLAEPVTPWAMLGLATVVFGLWLAHWRAR
ncbi:MAG: DMT family transporter [Chloroflexota bacterium]